MSVAGVVLAGGSGTRLGGPKPKQLLPIGGRMILVHSLERFEQSPLIDNIVLIGSHETLAAINRRRTRRGAPPPRTDCNRLFAEGGPTRMASSWNALQLLRTTLPETEIVLIHDAARPFISPTVLEALIAAARTHGAAIPVLPAVDTTVQFARDEATGANLVAAIPPRASLGRVQTPQAFRFELILRAFERARADGLTDATDDSSLVFRLGLPVACVAGDERTFKITTQADYLAARALHAREFAASAKPAARRKPSP